MLKIIPDKTLKNKKLLYWKPNFPPHLETYAESQGNAGSRQTDPGVSGVHAGNAPRSDMTQFFLRQLFPRDKTEREGETKGL